MRKTLTKLIQRFFPKKPGIRAYRLPEEMAYLKRELDLTEAPRPLAEENRRDFWRFML